MNEYWDKRASNYLTWKEGFSPYFIKRNLIYTPILKYMLKKKIEFINPVTLLEVGCGTGRLFSLYRDLEATCIDSSREMLKRACDTCMKLGYNIRLENIDICSLDFNNIFDLIITSNVLLHISHEDIEKAVSNICKFSKEVVCIEWVDSNGKEVEGCYLHDYIRLFKNNNFMFVDSKKMPFEKQVLFHFKKEER